jgi:hypothetical protein
VGFTVKRHVENRFLDAFAIIIALFAVGFQIGHGGCNFLRRGTCFNQIVVGGFL